MSGYRDDVAYIHDAAFGAPAAAGADELIGLLQGQGMSSGTIVELGCGSGISARRLVDAGYSVVGYDQSAALLDIARTRVPEATFHQRSYVDAELPIDAVAVLAVGEVFNYKFDENAGPAALQALFGCVHDSLRKNGLFVFDMAGPNRGMPTRRVWEATDDWAIMTEVTEQTSKLSLTRKIISFRQAAGGYRRDDELHELLLYSPIEVLRMLRAAGLRARSRAGYGDKPLGPGWRVFVASKN